MVSATGPTPAECLAPGYYVDSDSAAIGRFVEAALADLAGADDRARAVRLFEAVRDGLRYDPYGISFDAADYRASAVAGMRAAWCVPKAILLTACLRRAGIPAALGFADVRNHLSTPRLAALMGTDLFIHHGYVRLWLGEESWKVTPAFNIELCERFGVRALVFDGHSDALFHEADAAGRRHMEYVRDRGAFADAPVPAILDDMARTYPVLREASLSAARPGDARFDGPSGQGGGTPG